MIVTGPGETFTEYGIAVKERSPGAPTLYAGYTNELLGYLPTAERVPVRRLRGRLRLQERRAAVALRPERRGDPRQRGRPAGRAPLPRGGAVGRPVRAGRLAATLPDGSRRRPFAHPSPGRRRCAREPRAHRRDRRRVLGRVQLPAVLPRAIPDVELVGVVRKTEDGLDEFRREFGLEVATTSVAELLAAGVDGVVVTSPHASPPRARGRGARGRRPRARREADDRQAGRRRGDPAAARTSGKTAAVALRVELRAACDLGEGDARGRPHRPRHVGHRLQGELA